MFKSIIKYLPSLILTMLTAVCVSFAWYSLNDTVTAINITAISSSGKVISANLERYVAVETKENDTTYYTCGDSLSSSDFDISQIQYSVLSSYKKVIYKITAKLDLSLAEGNTLSISLKNRYQSRDTTISEINKKYYNYLSNVAQFNYLENNNGTFSVTKYPGEEEIASKELEFGTSSSTINLIDNLSVNTEEVSIYLLFDYNKENVSNLLALNLGNYGGDDNLFFREDLFFMLS